MEKSEKRVRVVRFLEILLLCALLTACLLIKPIKQTIAYIQVTSGTCVNTFVGEATEEPTKPTKPSEPEEPTKPEEPTEPTKATEPSAGTEPSVGETEAPRKESEKPRTGDGFNLGGWAAAAGASLLVLVAVLLTRAKAAGKKEKK